MNDTMPSTPFLHTGLVLATERATTTGPQYLAQVIYMGFAKRLIELRKARGWTQHELAEQLEMGLSQIKRYELGQSQPTLGALKKMATTFRVSVDELVFDKGALGVAANTLDTRLLELFEEISKLPADQREAVKFILDSVVANARLMVLAERQQVNARKG